MGRNYFVCSVGDPNDSSQYDTENFERCQNHKCFVLIPTGREGCIGKIQKGDILFLKYQKFLVAYGIAVSALQTDQDVSEDEGWDHRIDVAHWNLLKRVSYYGILEAQMGGTNFDTVKQVTEDFAINRLKAMGA
jgi:hypothetical protein